MARHTYPCLLSWSDTDVFGHIDNAVFVRYLEDARSDFLFTQAAEAQAGGLAGDSVLARHEIDYKRPLAYRPEPVTIEIWVTRIGGTLLTLGYEIKDTAEDGTETVYARASTVVVLYDSVEGRPRRISAVERQFLMRFTDGPPAAVAS